LGAAPAGMRQTPLALAHTCALPICYSPSAGARYDAMTQTFATTGGTAHSTPVSGLVDGGSYAFYVRCLDAAANASPDDFAIAFTDRKSAVEGKSVALRSGRLMMEML